MDTTKWKSILVPIDTYKDVKQRAQSQGRSISGELQIEIAEAMAYRQSAAPPVSLPMHSKPERF